MTDKNQDIEKKADKDAVKKGDFVELKYTGYTNGEIFDSNIESDLKKISPDGKPQKTIVVVGEGMVVPGLDKALEGKKIGTEYAAAFSAKEGFGERKRELVKTIPLKAFTEGNVNPKPGMVLSLDNNLVKIITVSGARVITDFNNPLSGKDIEYTFTITREVTAEDEKIKTLFENLVRFVPEFEVKDKIVVKGTKDLERIVTALGKSFKRLIGKELAFEEVKPEKKDESKEAENKGDEKTSSPKSE